MFKRIYFFYLTYLIAMVYSQTLLMLWFFQNGVSYVGMLFYFLLIYLPVLPLSFLLKGRKFSSRGALLVGVAASAGAVLMSNFITGHTYLIFFISLIFTLNTLFFWVIYSTMHFKYSHNKEHGFKSGAYYLLVPVLGVFLAPLAGLIAERFGYHFLFYSSMLLYAIPFCLVFFLPSFDFEFKAREALYNTKHSLLITFQGSIFMLVTNIIPIFTLFFITTPLKLGSFFGYLAVFAAFASLFNAKMSDRIKKRASFFYIFTGLNSLSFIPLVFSNSLAGWQIFSGINSFTYGLANPFSLAMILDHNDHNIENAMLARQIYSSLGAIFIIVLLLCVYYLTSSWESALICSALVPLLYPVIAYFQKLYIKK